MGYLAWMNRHVKSMDVWDIAFVKWSVFFFTLFLVAIIPEIASLAWYWYLIVAIALMIRPMIRILA